MGKESPGTSAAVSKSTHPPASLLIGCLDNHFSREELSEEANDLHRSGAQAAVPVVRKVESPFRLTNDAAGFKEVS